MEEINNIKNVNWELLARFLNDEASESEKAEVETWAGLSGENLAELESSRKLMEKSALYFQTGKFNPAVAWEKIRPELKKTAPVINSDNIWRTRYFRIKVLQVAASVLLALILGSAGFYLGFRQHKTAVFTEVISNDRQVLNGVTLPDGTHVTLNSNSKLTYPKEFSGNLREVSIEGEAFFEVEPDASRPFIISAGKAKIKVLGTSFNVNAKPGVGTVEVVVTTGKVQVFCQRPVQQPCNDLILTPGERGVLSNADNQLVKSFNDNPNVIAWKTHDLVFNDTKLTEVIRNLENVYHTEIQLSDPLLNDLVLTAHFDNQTIDFILEVIRLTFNLELSAENGQYFLTAAANNP
jgi:transmembrane sensor